MTPRRPVSTIGAYQEHAMAWHRFAYSVLCHFREPILRLRDRLLDTRHAPAGDAVAQEGAGVDGAQERGAMDGR